MLNIIIPLAGTGLRFLREGYIRPKPFVKVWGRELILWLLESLTFHSNDTLVLVFNAKPELGLSTKGFFTLVEEYFLTLPPDRNPQVKYICITETTVGAAATVQHGIEALSTERLTCPVVLLDGDTFYNVDILALFRDTLSVPEVMDLTHSSGGAVVVFDDDRPDDSPYSYVKTDPELNTIERIREKNKDGMSGLACSGCYCFNHTLTLKKQIKNSLKVFLQGAGVSALPKELYTSTIIANMLELGGCFKPIKLERTAFNVLGTPSQLKIFLTSLKLSHDRSKKRFCFDLDNTLVTTPTVPGDYCTCKPIYRVIDYLQKLHADGYYIIIHTARRMRTHKGNLGRVVADIGAITIQQMRDFAIPYDELIFGKPFADFYIDDKAVLPFVDDLDKETGVLP